MVYRIRIFEPKPPGYLKFFGFGLDWISFSLQLDRELDYPNEINCDHRKNLKWINSVWEEKIHYLQMILVKIYFSIFSRFRVIFPVARDPNFQAEEEDISTFMQHALQFGTV